MKDLTCFFLKRVNDTTWTDLWFVNPKINSMLVEQGISSLTVQNNNYPIDKFNDVEGNIWKSMILDFKVEKLSEKTRAVDIRVYWLWVYFVKI